MHGINTIKRLNEIAEENANAKVNLEKAEKKWANNSPLDRELALAAARRQAEKQAIVDKLSAESVEELVSRVEALENPNALELALANKLKELEYKITQTEGGN